MEEDTIAGHEGSMAEWTTRLQALLQKESNKRMDPVGGKAPCRKGCSSFYHLTCRLQCEHSSIYIMPEAAAMP